MSDSEYVSDQKRESFNTFEGGLCSPIMLVTISPEGTVSEEVHSLTQPFCLPLPAHSPPYAFDDVFHEILPPFEAIKNALTSKKPLVYTVHNRHANKFYTFTFFSKISSPENGGIFLSISDLTTMYHLKKHCLEAERDALFNAFIPTLAHNLNNPLEGIKNYLFLLSDPHLDSDMFRNYLAIIESQVSKIAQTMRNVAWYYLGPNNEKEQFDLQKLFDLCLVFFALDISQKEIRVLREFTQKENIVSGFPILIHRALFFLIMTCIEKMEKHDVLKIATTESGADVVLSLQIRDVLYSSADLKLAFCSFSEYMEKHELIQLNPFYLIQNIMSEHDGTLEIHCDEQIGTIFKLSFPKDFSDHARGK